MGSCRLRPKRARVIIRRDFLRRGRLFRRGFKITHHEVGDNQHEESCGVGVSLVEFPVTAYVIALFKTNLFEQSPFEDI